MADSGIFKAHQPSTDAPPRGIAGLSVDSDGGIDLRQIPHGTVLEVQTKNTAYTLIPQPSGETLIWGHPEYCPEPTLVAKLGSAYLTGVFREDYLCPGLRLTFPHGIRRVCTSRILSIQAKPKH